MRPGRAAAREVDPRIAAAAIILVLAAIQIVWWRGLVFRPRVTSMGQQSGPGTPRPDTTAVGVQEVTVDTLAGDPQPGDTDGPGRDARFDSPGGIAIGPGGEVYVADTRNNCIRVIAPDGRTRTLAGSAAGFRDGDSAGALFRTPGGVAVAPDGTVYVADSGNHRIRRIRAGQVTTVAGGPPGMADGPAGVARFDTPTALCWATPADAGRVLLVADSGNHRIRAVELAGASPTVRTVRTLPGVPTTIAARGPDLLTAMPDRSALSLGSRDMVALTIQPTEEGGKPDAIKLRRPFAAAPAPDGWYVADAGHGAVLTVASGEATVLAGECHGGSFAHGFRDGTGDRCAFGQIAGLAADGHGHIYVADASNNAIRRITLPTSTAER